MSDLRYCRKCDLTTPHDKTDFDHRTASIKGLTRLFLGVVTAGTSEVIREPAWECQKCGKLTKR